MFCVRFTRKLFCVCMCICHTRTSMCVFPMYQMCLISARARRSKSQDRIRAFLLSDKNDYFFVLLLCTMEWIFLLNGHKKTNTKIHCCSRYIYIFKQRILFCSSCKMGYELLFLFDSGELLRHKGEYTQR